VALADAAHPSTVAAQRRRDPRGRGTDSARPVVPPSAPGPNAGPTALSAEDDAAARQHFEAGRLYFQRAQYDDAVREFTESYRLSRRPALLLNIARAEELAGRPDRAVAALESFAAEAPTDDPERAGLDERLARLRADAARRAATQGASGTPSEGGAVAGGGTRLGDAGSGAASSSRSDGAAGGAGDGASDVRPASGGGLGGLTLAGIATLSGAGALALGAAVTGIVAAGLHGDLADACGPGGGCPADRAGDISTGRALALTSTILTGAAVVAGGVGLFLLLLPRGGEAPVDEVAASRSARLVPGPGLVGAGLEVVF
jgi:hypothetical protein